MRAVPRLLRKPAVAALAVAVFVLGVLVALAVFIASPIVLYLDSYFKHRGESGSEAATSMR